MTLPVVALALAACGTDSAPSAASDGREQAVATAAQPSTPEETVTAYVAALNAHDEAAVRRMSAPGRILPTADGITNIISISDLKVYPPVPAGTGPGSLASGYEQAVQVGVEFTLKQAQPKSMPDGHTFWGYLLVRNADSENWLIVDEGVA